MDSVSFLFFFIHRFAYTKTDLVFEKADYPRKDNSNYPYSFFSNLLPLLISAIGKLNKINILFENRRVFGVFTMWENKKPWDMRKVPISQGLIFSVGR